MNLITRKGRAITATNRWYKTYHSVFGWESEERELVYNKLVACRVDTSYQEVNEIIGNNSWTDCWCTECGKSVDAIVPLDGSDLCLSCLSEAIKLFESC